jgi:hypothetical protein
MRIALSSALVFGSNTALAADAGEDPTGATDVSVASGATADETAVDAGDGTGGAKGDKKGPDKVGPIKKDKYPKQVRYRPLTMSKGMAEIGLDLDYTLVPDVDDVIGAGLGVRYGLAPTVDIGVSTGLALAPDADWDHHLVIGAGYLAYDTAPFDLAVTLDLDATVVDGGGVGVALGVPMRYLAGDTWDIHGNIGIPIFFDPDFFLGVSLNPGVGAQLSGGWYLALDTNVLNFSTLSGSEATHLGNQLPLDFRVTYAIDRQFDLGGHILLPIVWQGGPLVPTIGIFGRGRF